jgi:hypothetical protein
MPTSITTAPGLSHSPLTKLGFPMAATRMSASRMTAGMSGVREWQMVTVAFSCWRRVAAGTPTMLLRPRTTARFPSMGILYRFRSSMQPCARKRETKGGREIGVRV